MPVVLERRPTLGAGCAASLPPQSLVLPITTRETRSASVCSVASILSATGPPRKSSSSVLGLAGTRRRTSSIISVVSVGGRKETWANIETPDAHWHPNGVGGLSFGMALPEDGSSEPPRRRASSLVSTRGLAAASQVSVVQAQPVITAAPAPVAPAQPAPSEPPTLGYPASYTLVQQPVNTTLTTSIPPQSPQQSAHVVYDVPAHAPAANAVVMPAATTAPVMMPNQAMHMPYATSYMQAPGGGYMLVSMVPAATMQMAHPLSAQAQQIHLSSLIAGSTAMPTSPTPAATVTTTTIMPGVEPITTVMLRNIPQKYDREALLDALVKTGFGGSFDFFYLPIDFSTTNSVGYAFINFVNEAECARFRAAYVGKKLSEESPKVCEVCDAKLQGKAKNVDFYRNSTVMGMDEKYHPILIENGMRVQFPKPTRPIGPVQRRPPRSHPKQF